MWQIYSLFSFYCIIRNYSTGCLPNSNWHRPILPSTYPATDIPMNQRQYVKRSWMSTQPCVCSGRRRLSSAFRTWIIRPHTDRFSSGLMYGKRPYTSASNNHLVPTKTVERTNGKAGPKLFGLNAINQNISRHIPPWRLCRSFSLTLYFYVINMTDGTHFWHTINP